MNFLFDHTEFLKENALSTEAVLSRKQKINLTIQQKDVFIAR